MLIKLTNCFPHFRYDAKEDKLKPSTFQFKIEELIFLKLIILKTFKLLHFLYTEPLSINNLPINFDFDLFKVPTFLIFGLI